MGGLDTLMSAANASSDWSMQVADLTKKLSTDGVAIAMDVKNAIDTIARYCSEHRDDSFIQNSDTGLRWANAYEQGYGEIDEILSDTSLFADWVPFADDVITSLVTMLMSYVGALALQPSKCLDLLEGVTGLAPTT